MNNIVNEIKSLSKQILTEIIEYRRHIHKNPELAFEEFETASFISKILKKYNIKTDVSFGINAVIGIIEGNYSYPVIGLRADIDALPIQEQNNVEYKSLKSNIMHACGHDVHTASLLGTAIILKKLQKNINGKIILIFQPAEEKIPGGAKILIENGLIEKYNIKAILGQHVLPELQTGYFAFGHGEVMAATDEIYYSVSGIGGHAALPHKRSDTVMALVNFLYKVNEYQMSIISEKPFIIAFGKLNAPGALNAIPSEAFAEGTMRTFNEELRNKIKSKLYQIADETSKNFKCSAKLQIKEGYPSVYNDPDLYKKVMPIAEKYLGKNKVLPMEIRMTAEDFAYYGKKVPSLFYRMGIASANVENIGLHNPNFNVDENALEFSSGLMAFLALELLNNL